MSTKPVLLVNNWKRKTSCSPKQSKHVAVRTQLQHEQWYSTCSGTIALKEFCSACEVSTSKNKPRKTGLHCSGGHRHTEEKLSKSLELFNTHAAAKSIQKSLHAICMGNYWYFECLENLRDACSNLSNDIRPVKNLNPRYIAFYAEKATLTGSKFTRSLREKN